MHFVRKILGVGLLAAGVVYLKGRRKALEIARGAGADARFDDNFGTSVPDDDMVAVATESGIADVDPEPLSHVAGEGIDLTRDTEAHESIAAVRERMPRH